MNAPALTFKTAVIFRRAMTEGGLYAQMMPGVFTTAEALADGIKTHKALAREPFVYMPVDVTLDERGSPTAVEPIRTLTAMRLLEAVKEAFDEFHHPGAHADSNGGEDITDYLSGLIAVAEGRS